MSALAQLSPEENEGLAAAVEALPAFANVPSIEDAATEALAGTDVQAIGLVAALLSLRGQTREIAARDIAQQLVASPTLEIEPDRRDAFIDCVSRLLESDAIATTAIAVDLQTQHSRNFASARVFTDIRPVFRGDVGQRPAGAVLSEVLLIETWDRDGEGESLYIALDEADLLQLQDVISRALKKTETLKTLLSGASLDVFSLDDESEE